jgi:hypothetical protein
LLAGPDDDRRLHPEDAGLWRAQRRAEGFAAIQSDHVEAHHVSAGDAGAGLVVVRADMKPRRVDEILLVQPGKGVPRERELLPGAHTARVAL